MTAPRRLALLACAGLVLLSACGSTDSADSAAACGWDVSTPQGQAAMTDRLDLVSTWLVERPGEPPPPIDSPYWRGECESTPGDGPPIHEHEGDEHGGDGLDEHGHVH